MSKTMQEDYVNFEQAKALKELGFHYACRTCYIYDATVEWNSDITEMFCGDYAPWMDFNIEPKTDNCEYISAPTLSVVQKWLRERKIWLSVDVTQINWVGEQIPTIYEFSIAYYNAKPIFINSKLGFETYEEALSAGIDKCLELLKEKSK